MDPCPFEELHETFATIGYLICEFANFEGRLMPVLALMLNDTGDQASVILGQVDSFAYKWSTVVGVAETVARGDHVAEAVLKIRSDVKEASSFRNKIAHSGSRIHGAELWLVVNATTTKRGAPKGELITRSMVQAQLDRIRGAIDALDGVIDWSILVSTV